MTVAIELANRSGVAVEEAAAEELARSVLAAEGIEEGELGIAFVGPDEIRRLKQEHLGIDEETDVLSFPLDGRDELPEGVPRQLGDAVVCPQVVGRNGAGRSSTVCCISSATSTARRWRTASARTEGGRERAGPRTPAGDRDLTGTDAPAVADRLRELQLRLPGRRSRAAHAPEHARARRHRGRSPDRRDRPWRLPARADRAAPLHHVRPRRRDAQHRDRERDRRGHHIVRPARQAGQGHRRRSGADLRRERARRRLPRLFERDRAPERAAAAQARERAGGADAHRAGRGHPRGARDEGDHGARDAPARRTSLRPRRTRLRGMDGRDARPQDSSHQFLVSSLALIMALLVAQTRVESGVHSTLEVAYGAALGALVTLVLFQVAP